MANTEETVQLKMSDLKTILFNLNNQEEPVVEEMGGMWEGCTSYQDKEDGGNWQIILNNSNKVVSVWFD